MSKKMLINATHPEENRVAIVTDGILNELDIEVVGKEQTKGNIYKGTVVRVEPGLQAAFVDYGAERLGFLQMGEIHPSCYKAAPGAPEQKGRPRINDILQRGQELLLQIVKEERGTKGAALTTFLSLPGRYMVLMPESDTKGISRKIENEGERKKLKETMSTLDLPADIGYIVRTAGIGQSREELGRDLDYLIRLYRNIVKLSEKVRAPALIYRESNLVIRSIRDYFSKDMDEVLIDDAKVFQEAKDFFQQVMPEHAPLVKLHQERRPIFARYQIEEQIETISKNKVALPSGGSIVIDTTEALVAIDVNSGKMAGEQGVESTAYKTNLEAATEIGRQLRLRDLGGLIVVDFIDMRDRQHIREVEKNLKDALKDDKARVTVGRISSQFGLLEMSRQRIKAALAEGTYNTCPHCHGTGRIKSVETQAIAFLRKVYGGIARGQIDRIEGEVPLEVATYLLNSKREELLELERSRNVSITIKGKPDLIAGEVELTFQKREKDSRDDVAPVEFSASQAQTLAGEMASEEESVLARAEKPAEPEKEGKKRRRRRKKKPVEGAEAIIETTEEPPQAAVEEEESAPEEAASPATEAEPAAAEATPPKKRPRRRRKPSTGKSPAQETEAAVVEQQTTTTPETPEHIPAEPAPQPASTGTDQIQAGEGATEKGEEAARKKRRRRAAKSTMPAGEEQKEKTGKAEADQAEPAPQKSSEPSEVSKSDDKVSTPEDETATKPTRARRSRSSAKKPAETAEEKAPAAGKEKTQTESTSPAKATEEKKPAARSRRRTSAKKSDTVKTTDQDAPPAPTPEAPEQKTATGETASDKSAAKRPTRRKKPAAVKKEENSPE
ncbi:Rne/Rng family ribonuclease [Desulfuromonas sp. KJ2020]|uniref:Rne/Rng family ribonuclease n=1 Tax=Desulfuromonas sp. KJ2020 TaxID=2919173 RepID=UPI0020A7189B|nr:Rne/Rng family ribonuclease [Desulfuromonas sp. KJ2020]MCP3177032.1 Rne/Rng family ribonuclease [Desulfuromonas sp. KJ2020]